MCEIQGQRHRSAGADRPIRRRCPALHARRPGRPGARYQARGKSRRRLPQLRHQAVERRPILRNQRMRAGWRDWMNSRQGTPSTVGSPPKYHEGAAAGRDGDRGLSIQRRGGIAITLVWNTFCDWYLDLRHDYKATRLTRAVRDRDTRHGGLGVGSDPASAPSADALHHRGVVARYREARRALRSHAGG